MVHQPKVRRAADDAAGCAGDARHARLDDAELLQHLADADKVKQQQPGAGVASAREGLAGAAGWAARVRTGADGTREWI